jgi:D-glycero-alpha-D-manno-heptose 1-phosphate guanylyltransferase
MKEAIVLAGGFGTRLRSILADKPKPMAPINGRPFLAILLEQIAKQGIQRVVLSVGYKAADIMNYFGKSFAGIEIEYEIETQPLGTGGAVRASLARCTNDPVLILNGDTFLELDMVVLDALWSRYQVPLIVAREVEDTTRYGRLRTCDERVIGFEEKTFGGPGLINAGVYVFPRSLLETFPDSSSFALESDFLAQYVHCHEFRLYVSNGYFIDIGVPEDYERAQHELPRLMS